MSTSAGKKWIVRNTKGITYGPFEEERIFELIRISIFTGDEAAAEFPGGEWTKLSKIPKFYDLILESLARETPPIDEATKRKELSQTTVILASQQTQNQPNNQTANQTTNQTTNQTQTRQLTEDEQRAAKADSEDDRQKRLHRKKSAQEEAVKEWPSRENATPVEAPVEIVKPSRVPIDSTAMMKNSEAIIDLVDEREVIKKKRSQNLRPILFLGVVLVLSYFILNMKDGSSPSSSAIEKLHLQSPAEAPAEKLSAEATQAKIKRALSYFILGTVKDYTRAQSELVDVVSSDKLEKNALALLCLTYRELWPFAHQDSTDMSVVQKVVKQASAADPMGGEGAICRIVLALLKNEYDSADSMTKGMLEQFPNKPVFYELRASILLDRNDANHALGYLSRCRELWPQWAKPYLLEAQTRILLGQYPQAKNILETVVKQLPKHPEANVLLGILEAKHFQDEAGGAGKIQLGLSEGRITPLIEAQGLTALARHYMHQGQKKKAVTLAERAQDLDPTNLEAVDLSKELGLKDRTKERGTCLEIVALGDKFMRDRNYVVAQAEYRAAFEKCEPQMAKPAIKAAEALWKLNQGRDAIEWLQKAVAADPSATQAFLTIADYSSQRFDFVTAGNALREAERTKKDLQQIYRSYALVELRRNSFADALRFSERAIKLYDSDLEAHIIASRALMQMKELQRAYQYAARAIDLDRFDPNAQGLYGETLALFQSTKAGAEYMRRLINTYPSQAAYRMSYARILRQDEKFDLALAEAQKACELEPVNKDYLMEMGELQVLAEKTEDARKSFLSASALDPSDPRPLFILGRLYLQLEKYSDALKYLEKAGQVNPRFPRVHSMTGRAALLMGDFDQALKSATMEKKTNPSLADSYLLAGEVYMRRKDPSYGKAIGEFQNAIRLKTQGAEVYILIGRAHRLAGNLDTAISMLNVAISKESGNPEIYKELGAIHEKRGQPDQARQNYARYLQLAPGAPDATLLRERMERLGGGR